MSTGKMAAVLAALAIFGTALGTRVCFAAEPALPVFFRTEELLFSFTVPAFSSVTGIYSIKASSPLQPYWFSSSRSAMISVSSIFL